MNRLFRLLVLVTVSFVLSACLETTSVTESKVGPKYALAELVSNQIRRCWYGEGRTDFAAYAAESDINPIFNRARILVLPKGDLEGKPVLIIESVNKNKKQASVSAYGPLMQGALGSKVTADLQRWTGGSQACS